MSQSYLVLDSDPHDDSRRWDLGRRLDASLPGFGWVYRFRHGGDDLYRDIWEAADSRAIVSLVADLSTPSHYVMVESSSEELTQVIVGRLTQELPVVSLVDLIERARQLEDPGALVRLALGTDPVGFDDESVGIIKQALRKPDALTRYRAAEAAGIAPSRSFLTQLNEMADDDSDESVRLMARAAAVACERAD